METSIAASILLIGQGMLAQQWPLATGKAQVSEVLSQASVARVGLVEQLAFEGQLALPVATAASVPSSSGRFQYAYQGGQLIASGEVGGHAMRLGFRPAFDETGWSVLWLCGQRRPPPGWTAEGAAIADGLTADQLPFMCKDVPLQRSDDRP